MGLGVKKIVRVIVIFFIGLILLSYSNSSFAREEQVDSSQNIGYVTKCLKMTKVAKTSCYGEDVKGETPECVDVRDYPFPDKKDHTGIVEGEGFPPGVAVYIVGCIPTERGYVCTGGTRGSTTGVAKQDTKFSNQFVVNAAYQNSNVSDSEVNKALRQMGFDVVDKPDEKALGFAFEFGALQNPVYPDGGKVSVVVRSYTSVGKPHSFFGVYRIEQRGAGGQGETIQYGTLLFTDDPQQCVSIHWDPEGRVFDSVSLEPIPGATVKILDQEGNLLPARPGFSPIKITQDDGIFRFFVDEGVYKLEVEKENYSFPVRSEEVNPNFQKIYSCDIPDYDLYEGQELNVPKGVLVHCDVPLKPLLKPYISDVQILEYGCIRLGSGNTKCTAKFSHPLAIGKIWQSTAGSTKKYLITKQADKDGKWEVIIDKADIKADTPLELEVEKPKDIYSFQLQKLSVFRKIFNNIKAYLIRLNILNAHAQSNTIKRTTLRIEPILPYIAGYAYDDKGNVLPNAEIKIISQSTGNVLYKFKADSKGYFKVPPSFAPALPYYIQIEAPLSDGGRKIYTYTTSQFVSKNKDYLTKEGIDLLRVRKNNKPIEFTKEEITEFEKNVEKSPQEEQTTISQEREKGSNQMLKEQQIKENKQRNLLIAIISLLLVGIAFVGVLLIYYIKKQS